MNFYVTVPLPAARAAKAWLKSNEIRHSQGYPELIDPAMSLGWRTTQPDRNDIEKYFSVRFGVDSDDDAVKLALIFAGERE